jgi:acetyl-CoA C-acetyltransferase
MGRVVATLLGYDGLPGTTRHPLLLLLAADHRMALHAIKAGEGDVFISAGVEWSPATRKGSSDSLPDTRTRCSPTPSAHGPSGRAEGGADDWDDPRESGELPDVYIAMGQTAENLAQIKGITRQEHGRVRRALAEPGREGHRRRLLGPRDHPGHPARRHGRHTDDGPRAGVTLEAWPRSSRSSARTARSPPATAAR